METSKQNKVPLRISDPVKWAKKLEAQKLYRKTENGKKGHNEYQKKYWQNLPVEKKQSISKKRYISQRDKMLEKQRVNRDKFTEYQTAWRKTPEGRIKLKQAQKRWREKNRNKINLYAKTYREKRKMQEVLND